MKFFVDTAEIDQIKELNDLGMVDGVTTNPSLIKKSGRDIIEVTKDKTSNHSSRTKMSLLTPIDSLKPKARIKIKKSEILFFKLSAFVASGCFSADTFLGIIVRWLRPGRRDALEVLEDAQRE